MPVEVTPEGRKYFERRGGIEVIAPPLERYVEGPPPEVEAKPLREEPIPIRTRIEKIGERPKPVASDLVPIIKRLRTDATEATQLKIEFNGETGWVVPSPRYTIYFKKSEGRVVDALRGARTAEELKERHKLLEVRYPPERGYRIEPHFRADKDTWFFWVFSERKPIYRDSAEGIAREVCNLYPHRLALQYMKVFIKPPPGLKPSELPFGLRITPPPRYGR